MGVAGDTKYNGVRQPIPRLVYTPPLQQGGDALGVTFEVRTAGDPLSLVEMIRREVQQMNKNLPIYDVRTLSSQVGDSLAHVCGILQG